MPKDWHLNYEQDYYVRYYTILDNDFAVETLENYTFHVHFCCHWLLRPSDSSIFVGLFCFSYDSHDCQLVADFDNFGCSLSRPRLVFWHVLNRWVEGRLACFRHCCDLLVVSCWNSLVSDDFENCSFHSRQSFWCDFLLGLCFLHGAFLVLKRHLP